MPEENGYGNGGGQAGQQGAPINTSGRAARHGSSYRAPRQDASQTAAGNAAQAGAQGNTQGNTQAKAEPVTAPALVRQLVRSLHLGEPMKDGPLCVIPIHSAVSVHSKYVLLQEAIERGTLTITEVSDSGSVPQLTAVNQGPWPVLIFDGEELVGAKQNRIANATILVSVGKTVLPVSCVEAGRWSRSTAKFDAGTYASHPKLRREKERQVLACMMASEPAMADEPQAARAARYRSDQHAVWEEVARTQAQMGVHSHTGALTDTFAAGKDSLERILKALDLNASPSNNRAYRTGRAVGVAVFIHGQFVCLDLLRPGKRFAMLYEKLLRGYALECLMNPIEIDGFFDPEPDVLRLLADLMSAGVKQLPSADLGIDLRLEGTQITGSGLAWQDELLQLSLFPKVTA